MLDAQLQLFRKTCSRYFLDMLDFRFQHYLVHCLLLRELVQPNGNELWPVLKNLSPTANERVNLKLDGLSSKGRQILLRKVSDIDTEKFEKEVEQNFDIDVEGDNKDNEEKYEEDEDGDGDAQDGNGVDAQDDNGKDCDDGDANSSDAGVAGGNDKSAAKIGNFINRGESIDDRGVIHVDEGFGKNGGVGEFDSDKNFNSKFLDQIDSSLSQLLPRQLRYIGLGVLEEDL
ncbi:conserved hypothetical protein [Ricinus communis]|uniref:Uncharacterized protein n=1 Tax=Ricinus communis TaxID=3988 RepID=B9SR19_RICCO|nr:conserved hypothetical protein [Ricinus communis]